MQRGLGKSGKLQIEKSPPWLCFSTCQEESLTKQWTIGPLLSQRFLLASAKAQPRGGFLHLSTYCTSHPKYQLKTINFMNL